MNRLSQLLLLGALCHLHANAQVPEYLPLQPGNEWVYAVTERPAFGPAFESTEMIRALENQERAGQTYALIERFFSDERALLRQDADGILWRWNESRQIEEELIRFTARKGELAGASYRGCNSGRNIVAGESETVTTPVAVFANAWIMEFSGTGPCPLGGVDSEAYVPYVGMVQRRQMSTGGGGRFRYWELVYSRTGGVTQLIEPSDGVSLSARADRDAPIAGQTARLRLRGRITIRSSVPKPSESLQAEISLRGGGGELVASTTVPAMWPGGEATREVQIPFAFYPVVPGQELPPGKYFLSSVVTRGDGSRSISEFPLLIRE